VGQLIVRGGGRDGLGHPLRPAVTTIGRSSTNDIVVPGDQVSRRHAEVRRVGDAYMLHDLGSRNGTLLNGRRVQDPQHLRHGDVIVLPGLTLLFDAEEESTTVGIDAAPAASIRVDTGAAEVWVRGRRVHVRPKEYLAMTLLWGRLGVLVTKEDLAAHVWPEHAGVVADGDIAQLIAGLRRKLEENPARPRHLITVRGLGYRLVVM
jgi:pSer/pThr/pTyr-binding forkhead associated (FHA) protein